MGKQFTIIIKNEDLSDSDVYMALRDYTDELLKNGDIEEYPEFEIIEME